MGLGRTWKGGQENVTRWINQKLVLVFLWKNTTTKKTLPSGSCNDLLLSYLLTYCGFGQFSRTYYCILVSLIERRRLQKHSPFSHFFLLFSPFRRWTSGWSDGGDRRVQVPVAKAVCGRVRLRWPRHPARHRVSHLQHLQWQRPVSSLTLNENKCVLYHLIFLPMIDKPKLL